MSTSEERDSRPSSSNSCCEKPKKYRSRNASLFQFRSYGRKKATQAIGFSESSSDEDAFDSPQKYAKRRKNQSAEKVHCQRSETDRANSSTEPERSHYEATPETQINSGNSSDSNTTTTYFEKTDVVINNISINDSCKTSEYNRTCSSDSQSDGGESNDNESSSSKSSDNSLDSDEDEISMFEMPMYNDANITVGASSILILQFCQKYNLPQKARDDLLKLVKQHCPEEAKQRFPKTYSKMLKLLIPVLKKVEKQTVCAACNKVISSSSTLCENGHVDRQENSFFYIIPLEPQLKMLLEGELSLSDFTISTLH